MIEKIKKIGNPLTMFGIFAALVEVSGTITIGLLETKLQSIFIWFLIGFPTALMASFFYILWKCPTNLYAPVDYKDENNYMRNVGSMEKTKMEGNKTDNVGTPSRIAPSSGEEIAVELIDDKKFTKERVKLDFKNFNRCTFEECELEFAGEGPVGLNSCQFDNPRWYFTAGAGKTLQFLSSIYGGFGPTGEKMIEETFESIKKGDYLK